MKSASNLSSISVTEIKLFWVVTPCSLKKSRRFGGSHLGSKDNLSKNPAEAGGELPQFSLPLASAGRDDISIRNVEICPYYTALQARIRTHIATALRISNSKYFTKLFIRDLNPEARLLNSLNQSVCPSIRPSERIKEL